ncbi:MAG TPA: serine hydrolase [Chloroflexia bacterium]|nr:serine hydrolase [Chloroflexia bacterium]
MRKTNRRFARSLLILLLAGPFLFLAPGPGLRTPEAAQAAQPANMMLYGSAPDSPDSHLQAILDDEVGDLPGNWGIAVKKLDTGQYAQFKGDEQQISASLYKLWVLAELFRQAKAGIIDLEGYTTVTGADAYYDTLLDDLRLPEGNSITLRRAAYMMVTVSDNTAAHLLVRTLGPDNINRFMQRNGLSHSYLDWSGVGDNLTTPLDVLRELEMMATSDMVDAEASKQMIEMMLDQQVNNLAAPGLPAGVPFAHKHGSLDALLHDAGVVYGPSGPFVMVIMSSDLDSYSTAYDVMPRLMRRVYEYFNTRPSSPALYFPQTRQTVGHDFLKFWQSFGGLDAFGYPIGAEGLNGGVLSQQFERARIEWHPETLKAGGPLPGVGLGLVGQERAAQLGLSWPPGTDTGQGKFFPQTSQSITGDFYDYWLNNGGERVFGLPISPATDMVNPSDGKTYLTQWFQRARLEIHPEAPAGSKVVRGALGSELSGSR